jgi:hypothetical protein
VSSNPPPSQLRTLIGGTCNASGNLTLKSIVPSRSFYSVFTAILKVTAGAPQWEIDLLGVPVGIGGGGVVVMGAIYANPGESFTLIVSGAAPNAVVSGGLYGFLSDTPETLPQLGVSSGAGLGVAAGALPGGQATVRGTLAAANDAVAIPTGGSAYVGIETSGNLLQVGTTLFAEGTIDDVNWQGLPVYDPNNSRWVSPTAAALSGQGIGGITPQGFVAPSHGYSQVRLRIGSLGGGQQSFQAVLRAAPVSAIGWPIGQQIGLYSTPVVLATDQTVPTAYRNYVAFAADAVSVATVAAEAMMTLAPVRAGVAGAGVTTIPVTAGKRLRIVSMTASYRNNAAAAHIDRFTLRTNPSGGAVIGSPTLCVVELYSQAALANVGQQLSVPLDPLEFAGTDQFGISHVSDAAAGFSTVAVNGFEYTP